MADLGVILLLPLTGNAWQGAVQAADEPAKPMKDWEVIPTRAVTPDYFETMGIAVVAGRGVRTADAGNPDNGIPGNAPFVAVINQTLADKCFPGRDPLGKKLRLSWTPKEPEIIGVVSNTRTDALTHHARPEVYFSLWQASAWVKHLVVRTEVDPRKLAVTVQRELRSIDPAVVIEHVKTLNEIRQDSVAVQTLTMRLLSSLLFEVHPADPATLIGATLLYAAVGLVACWVPARRAAKVDLMEALRCE